MPRFSGIVCTLVGLACAAEHRPTAPPAAGGSNAYPVRYQQQLLDVLEAHGMATMAAAVISRGRVTWSGQVGGRLEGVPATPETLFNVASITKTVTAELVVRLVNAGEISLDDSMAAHWVDPDLVNDPRHRALTPRLVLSHRTGLPNWRYQDPENKLRFIANPGEGYGYSGEGMDYVARFLEAKTGKGFEQMVREHVLRPFGIDDMHVAPSTSVLARLTAPVDAAGKRHRPLCNGPSSTYCAELGEWSAADEMATTVTAYARFMLAVMAGEGLNNELKRERFEVLTSTGDDPILKCPFRDRSRCPVKQGYGLGWQVFEFRGQRLVSHGGSDWSEQAMAYFDPDSRDGVVLFINGPPEANAEALIAGLRVLDEDSPMAALYQGWLDAYRQQKDSDT